MQMAVQAPMGFDASCSLSMITHHVCNCCQKVSVLDLQSLYNNNNKNDDNKNALQLMTSEVRAGQVLSLLSSLSCTPL